MRCVVVNAWIMHTHRALQGPQQPVRLQRVERCGPSKDARHLLYRNPTFPPRYLCSRAMSRGLKRRSFRPAGFDPTKQLNYPAIGGTLCRPRSIIDSI
jgi:hypothetical protein